MCKWFCGATPPTLAHTSPTQETVLSMELPLSSVQTDVLRKPLHQARPTGKCRVPPNPASVTHPAHPMPCHGHTRSQPCLPKAPPRQTNPRQGGNPYQRALPFHGPVAVFHTGQADPVGLRLVPSHFRRGRASSLGCRRLLQASRGAMRVYRGLVSQPGYKRTWGEQGKGGPIQQADSLILTETEWKSDGCWKSALPTSPWGARPDLPAVWPAGGDGKRLP